MKNMTKFGVPDVPRKVPSSNFEEIVKVLKSSKTSNEIMLKPGVASRHESREDSRAESIDVGLKSASNNVASSSGSSSVDLKSGSSETSKKSPTSSILKSKGVSTGNRSNSSISTPPKSVEMLTPVKSPASPNLDFLLATSSKPPQLQDHVKVFVHGEYLEKPVEHFNSAHYLPLIRENLIKMNYTQIFRTQMHSIPNIISGQSVVIINEKKSGKTFSYLPAILSSILFAAKEEPEGPIGLLVVKSSKEVEVLYKYCRILTSRSIKILKAFGQWDLDKKAVALINGCDLLITTPPFFTRVTNSDFLKTFDNDRLKHVVFDGIDSMWDVFQQDIKRIVSKCYKEDPAENPQTILVSSSWMEYIRGFMKFNIDPVVIIGSFAEAALYGKCEFFVKKLEDEEKEEKVLQIIKQHQKRKILIVVTDEIELNIIISLLMKKNIIWSTLNKEDEEKYGQKLWEEENPGHKVYILTDENLKRCFISSIEVLIHFSLPTNFSRFSQRFASMSGVFLKVARGEQVEKPVSVILLDQRNGIQIPKIVDFLKSRQVLKEVPPAIQELVEKIITEREKNKFSENFDSIMPLCGNIAIFGSCSKSFNCKKRHAFIASEKPLHIPCDGFVKFEFVGVHNPAHFTIKILEYLPQGAKTWISCRQKLEKTTEILVEMQENIKSSMIHHVAPKIGDLCAIFDAINVQWCRCRVLDREEASPTSSKPFKVRILFIDSGIKSTVRSDTLMVLPEQYKLIDPLVTELHITNLIPFDNDDSWDTDTTNELCKYFSDKKNSGDYMICKVELAVQNSIFTQSFEIRERFDEIDAEVTKYTLKKSLLSNNFCSYDDSVLTKLKKLATDCGFYVPTPENKNVDEYSQKVEKSKSIITSWKKLTLKCIYQVELKHFESPENFYVKVDSSGNKVLQSLMKVIDHCKQRFVMQEIAIDKLCLVVKDNQKPMRGIVKKIDPLKVFLVDFGEFVTCESNEVFEMPQQVAEIVPFQAVHCKMLGVKPKFSQEWMPRKLKAFQEFMKENCEGKILDLKVLEENDNRYEVLLSFIDSGERLDKLAIEENVAAQDFVREDEDFVQGEEINEDNLGGDDKALPASDHWKGELMNFEEFSKIFHPPSPQLEEMKVSVKRDRNPKPGTNEQQNIFPKTSLLDFIHKHPKIEWRQDRVSLYLIISAVDCLNFALNIEATAMKIVISYKDKFFEMAAFRLYGLIQPDLTSFEKAGQTIVVQAVKGENTMAEWPRLTLHQENTRVIKYSSEKIPCCEDTMNKLTWVHMPPDLFEEECPEMEDDDDLIGNQT